jgi:ankyrin repeat protein
LLLQQSGVEVNARAENGATALVVASLAGYDDVVRELLRHSEVDVNIFTFEDGVTALHHASAKNQKKIVEMLLEKNELLVNATMNNGATVLFQATQAGRAEIVRMLRQREDVDVNAQCGGGTALCMACQLGNLNVVKELLRYKDVAVNSRRKTDDATPLIMASATGREDLVRALLEHNDVDVNAKSSEDFTALTIASVDDRAGIVKALLENDKLEVNLTSKGYTALYLASNAGHVAVVCALLENNEVNVNLTCISGLTARGAAARNAPERFRDAIEREFQNYDDALLAVPENRDKLANAMTTKDAEPVELSYQYIKRYLTKPKLGSGAFGDVFLAKDGDLPEPKAFVVKKIKLSPSSNGPNDAYLKSFQKELSVRSGFCIECCIVWNNQPWPHLPRILTIMRNSERHSNDFVIPISLSCTATISMAVLESSFWCMNMQPMAPSTASSRTMT